MQGLQSKDVIMKVKSQIWRLLRNYKEKINYWQASEILINETIIKSNDIFIYYRMLSLHVIKQNREL